MHFSLMVAVPADTTERDLDDVLATLLAPFDENEDHDCPRTEENEYEEDCDACARHFFDWWQIGGRWSGFFDTGYDPEKDPANQEVCNLCDGTGTRPDGIERFGEEWAKWCNGCNGCQGTGVKTKWPTLPADDCPPGGLPRPGA